MADQIRIVFAGVERIDELEPIWKALHEHHRSVDPAIAGIPPRTADDTWPRRRLRYVAWLAEPDAFVLIAEDDGEPVAYALVSINQPADDTHETGDRWGELETLSVLPSHRGSGLGTRLMDRVFAELRTRDIDELSIAVMATNARALEFYERLGFRPWVVRTLGKVPPPSADRDLNREP